jgi:hypothetical protein
VKIALGNTDILKVKVGNNGAICMIIQNGNIKGLIKEITIITIIIIHILNTTTGHQEHITLDQSYMFITAMECLSDKIYEVFHVQNIEGKHNHQLPAS